MSNPVVGQDYVVNMVSPEDLTGATVTIEYRTPDNVLTEGVAPTSVDTSTNTISYKVPAADSVEGLWIFGAEITNSSGDISNVEPGVKVKYVTKLRK